MMHLCWIQHKIKDLNTICVSVCYVCCMLMWKPEEDIECLPPSLFATFPLNRVPH